MWDEADQCASCFSRQLVATDIKCAVTKEQEAGIVNELRHARKCRAEGSPVKP